MLGQGCTDDMPIQRRLRTNRGREAPVVDNRNLGSARNLGKSRLIANGGLLNPLEARVVGSTGKIYFQVSPEFEFQAADLQSVDARSLESGIDGIQVVRIA